jgi:hypothetical protein
MLLQVQPGSLSLGAPAWIGFVVVVGAVLAAAGVEFSRAVAQEAAHLPVPQMQFMPADSAALRPLAGAADPFLEAKRRAKVDELPAQF